MNSNFAKYVSVITTFLSVFYVSCHGVDTEGQISLDKYSFEKILRKFQVVLTKFDRAYPYGPKHTEFLKVVRETNGFYDFMATEVQVKDFGEFENMDLAKRFSLDSKEFPIYLLFIKGDDKPHIYKGTTDEDYTADKIINFIRSKDLGIYLAPSGCLEQFDKLAKQFVQTKNKNEQKQILKQAENNWDLLKTKSEQTAAEIYVKTMRKAIEDEQFITNERSRLTKLLQTKLSEKKEQEMRRRVNVIDSFLIFMSKSEVKEEL